MRVVFIEDVPNVAVAGDVKEVKNGFARNFLFPKNMAVLATRDQLRRVDALKRESSQRLEGSEARAQVLSQELDGLTIMITARTGPTGRLYGSVSAATIASELSKVTGHKIAGREVVLEEPIKGLGTYQTPIRLTPEVESTITVEVVDEEEEAPAPKRKRKIRVAASAVEAVPQEAETPSAEVSAIEAPVEEARPAAKRARAKAKVQVDQEGVDQESVKPAVRRAKRKVTKVKSETAEESAVGIETLPAEVSEIESPAEEARPAAKRARAKAKVQVDQEGVDQESVKPAVRRAKRKVTKVKSETAEESAVGIETQRPRTRKARPNLRHKPESKA